MNNSDRSAVSRRQLLGSAGVAITTLALPATANVAVDRPNILWLVSEDNGPFIGAYGDKVAHTPHIDELARRGILYENAYCTAPVCAPSRFSILTGVPAESCAPAQHMRANAEWPKVLKTFPVLMREAGYFCANLYKTDYNCDVDPDTIWDVQGPEGHWRYAPRDRPFMCVINTAATHESQMCLPVSGRVTPDQVRVPAYMPDTSGVRQDYASYYNLMERMDEEIGEHLAELERSGLADNTIVFYYSDNGGVMPRSKRSCYDEGERVALIIAVPPQFSHLTTSLAGSIVSEPVGLIDLAPTLLAITGVPQPAQMTGQSLLRSRSSQSRLAFGQRDRMDERYDLVRTVTDGRWRYIRNYKPHRPWGQHVQFQTATLRSYREWEALHLAGRLTPIQQRYFEQKPYEELYDVLEDPDQVNNLVERLESAEVTMRLRDALDKHMHQVNDNGFFAEGMDGEGYFNSRDRSVYPLDDLMKLAEAAAQRRPSNVPMFVAHLRSDTPVVRYWAALGLLMLGKHAASAAAELKTVIRGDPIAQVRIPAAELLATIGDPEAVHILGQLLAESRSEPVRLQALDALTYVGDAAEAVLPTISAAAREGEGSGRGRLTNVGNSAAYLEARLTGTYDPLSQGLSIEECQVQRIGARRYMG